MLLALLAAPSQCQSGLDDINRAHIRNQENQDLVFGYLQNPPRFPLPTVAPFRTTPKPLPLPASAVPVQDLSQSQVPAQAFQTRAPPAQAFGNAGFGSASGLDSRDKVDVVASDAIARSVLDFAHNLGQKLMTNYQKTEIFSPLSLMSSLALLMVGAKGRSHDELISLFDPEVQASPTMLHDQFGLMLNDVIQPTLATVSQRRTLDPWRYDRGTGNIRLTRRSFNRPVVHTVHVANGVFTKLGYSLNPDYRNVIISIYNAELRPVDFERSPAQARNTINEWVEQQTLGKITNIVNGDIPPSTRIIMASALYFKAFWEQDFIESATKLDHFYANGDAEPPIRVEMMATFGKFPYYEDERLNCRIIGMPYHGNLTTMYIIQPLHSTVGRLHQLQQNLNGYLIENMISKMVRRSALLAFPKLHLTESLSMKRMLKKLNIQGIFSAAQGDLSLISAGDTPASAASPSNANERYVFTRAAKTDGLESLNKLNAQRYASPAKVGQSPADLYVDDIVHKVDFVVNEQGTEAAAATVTYLNKSGPDVLFRVDSPFMILVRHDPTKLALFYGLINEPPAARESQRQ